MMPNREQPFVAVHGQAIELACAEDWCRASMTRAATSGERRVEAPELDLAERVPREPGAERAPS